jgi:hypothetical protein
MPTPTGTLFDFKGDLLGYMLPLITAYLALQNPATTRGSLSDQLAAAKAIAAYELAWWRKGHPKADLALSFSDPKISQTYVNLVRSRLGFKNPVAELNPHVLTLVLNGAAAPKARRMTAEAYAFFGSFPKGYRASYVIRTGGKEPKVLTRTVLQRYDQNMQGPQGP